MPDATDTVGGSAPDDTYSARSANHTGHETSRNSLPCILRLGVPHALTLAIQIEDAVQ